MVGHYEPKGVIGARQNESFIAAREYEWRGGHFEFNGMNDGCHAKRKLHYSRRV